MPCILLHITDCRKPTIRECADIDLGGEPQSHIFQESRVSTSAFLALRGTEAWLLRIQLPSRHVPHPGPLRSLLQVLLLYDHPEIINSVTATPWEGANVVNVVPSEVGLLTL